MYISVFTDELKQEVTSILPTFAQWGMEYVDFRGLINGAPIERQTTEQLKALKAQMDSLGLKTGVIQSSLCKKHLPDADVVKLEMEKLEGVIRAAEILECPRVRAFNFWQHKPDDPALGELAMRPDALSQVLEMFDPFARRAKEAGLILGFENCGQTPDEVIALLDMLNVPGWGMAWDVSNLFEILPEAQGDCIDYFTKALSYSNMIHVKCRGILPEVTGKKVPWDRVLRGAAVTGKDIPVSIETHLPAGIPGLTPTEATRRCYQFIKNAWPAAAPADMASALSVKETFDRPYRDNPVRFAVVGLGMGKNRCQQIIDTCGTELAGVCDIVEERARAVGEQFGVPYSTDINRFLDDPTVDVIYVVTPTGTHCDIAQQALRAGKHALVTKPMDAAYEKCVETAKFAEEKGLLFSCDFDMHFRGPLTELRMAVENGFFGKVKAININLHIRRTKEYYDHDGGWRGSWALDGGGALSNQGIHEIDRILSVFGMPEKVRCMTATQTFDIEAEDLGIAEMRYPNGMIARFSSTTSYPASSWYTRIDVYGDEGAYLWTSGGPEGYHIHWWKDGQWSEESPNPVKREWVAAADNFANAIRTGQPLIVTAANGINSRYVLDKLYESARTTRDWIDI